MLHMKKSHGYRLRVGCFSGPHQIYLVTTVTQHREPIFRDVNLGRILVRAMIFQQQLGKVDSLAFVVMPDHLHWLFKLGEKASLHDVVRRVKGYSAQQINALRQSDGPVWQSGFHDHALRRQEDVGQVARYVVANPLRAGLVDCLEDYPLWDVAWL